MLRPRAVLAALAFAALMWLTTAPAEACSCYERSPYAIPGPGSTVPPNPTLYVFVSTHYYRAGFDGGYINGGHAISRKVASTPAYEVWRHDVAQRSGKFVLRLNNDNYEYTIGPSPPNQVRVVSVEKTGDLTKPSGCASHVAIDLETTGNALAFRLAWDDGTSTILPTYRSEYTKTASSALGLLGCDEGVWNDAHMDKLRSFVLYALFADGAELKLGTSTARIGRWGWRVPIELVDARIDPPLPAPSTVDDAPPDIEVTTWWRQIVSAGAGALGAGILLLGTLYLVRPRRRDHLPRTT